MKLAVKYPLFVVVSTILTAGAIAGVSGQILRSAVEQELFKRGSAIADGFARASAPHLAGPVEQRGAQLKLILMALANNPDVLAARIASEQGIVLASMEDNEVDSTLPRFLNNPRGERLFESPDKRAFIFRSTARRGDDVVGTFVLTLSRDPVSSAVRRSTRLSLIFAAGIALALSLLTFQLARRLVAPLSLMTLKLRSIVAGDYGQRMDETRDDEIGELSRHFNSMLQRTELFLHYVDQSIIERLVADETLSAPGGRLSELTVIFADMRGYTSMSNRKTADEVVAVVNSYFHLLIECIAFHGGLVDKTMGDAVLAVFERHEDESLDEHARRAVLAVASMKAATRILNAFLRGRDNYRDALEAREFGFAVATGKAIVGNIGSVRRMDYTVCGRLVNLASRLEALTKHGEVVVDNFTRLASEHELELAALPPVQPKGYTADQKVTPYRVTGVGEERLARMRSFLATLFSFAYVLEHLAPAHLPVGQQHDWTQSAHRELQSLVRDYPPEEIFARVDTESGRVMSDSERRVHS